MTNNNAGSDGEVLPPYPGTGPQTATPPQPTFLRFPLGTLAGPDQILIAGVPFDGLSTEQSGSVEAPTALRSWSHKVGSYSVAERMTRRRSSYPALDAGNLPVESSRAQETFDAITTCVGDAADRGSIPILAGGDHSITYPAVTTIAKRYPDLRLVQIYAHHNATDPAEWRCRYNHGTFIRNLIQNRSLSGDRIVRIGIRDFQWRGGGGTFVRAMGVHVFSIYPRFPR